MRLINLNLNDMKTGEVTSYVNCSFDYNGHNIAYLKTGKGKPVLLLHGFAEDSYVWRKQVDFLQSYCQLIVPDLPGSGRSDLLTDTHALSMEALAACVYGLLQHEGIDQCIVIGHSMGGYITLALVEQYPAIISAFGFVHSTAYADNEEKKKNRQRGIEIIGKNGGHAFIRITTPNLFSKKFKEVHSDEIEDLIERGQSFTDKALQQYYFAMMNRPDRTKILSGSGKSVLFIIGTEDVAAPLNDVLKQTHLPAVAYIHILQNTGHMGMWESPADVNRFLLNFINQ